MIVFTKYNILVWSERQKQIIKKWRTLSSDQKSTYLKTARENRTKLMQERKAHQVYFLQMSVFVLNSYKFLICDNDSFLYIHLKRHVIRSDKIMY